jgi:AraC-like DNA-binding protein
VAKVLEHFLSVSASGHRHILSHSHSGYELHFIPHGSGWLSVSGRTYDISPGIFYLTGPDVFHEQRSDPYDPMAEYCINFEILKGANTHRNPKNMEGDIISISNALENTKFWYGKDCYQCNRLFESIIEEINVKHTGYYFSIKNYLNQIFINTARCFLGNEKSFQTPPLKNIDDNRRIIIDNYLNIHDRKHSINELSKKVGLGKRQLNRIMLQYYGMTFQKKLMQIKMHKAENLLKTTGLSVKDIASQVGIDDTSYFCRVFKKFWGVTPTSFRKSW